MERGVAHIRNCYLEIANIKQSDSCFILAKDRADRLAAREEDEKARLAEWDKAREAEERKRLTARRRGPRRKKRAA